MEFETIKQIGLLILTGLNIIFVIISFFAWIKKRKNAKTQEEKNEADEIIKNNLAVAIANIKSNLGELNLKFTTKAIKQAFKKQIKKEK